MFHETIITGHLGKDAELRYTPAGTPVANFPVAVSERWTGADGTKQESTTWYSCTAWQRNAETADQYLKKGATVMVVGRNTPPAAWIDAEGIARSRIEVRVDKFYMLDKKQARPQPGDDWPDHATGAAGGDSEDVPF